MKFSYFEEVSNLFLVLFAESLIRRENPTFSGDRRLDRFYVTEWVVLKSVKKKEVCFEIQLTKTILFKEYREGASSNSSFYDRQTAKLTTLEIIIFFSRIQCITISSLPACYACSTYTIH